MFIQASERIPGMSALHSSPPYMVTLTVNETWEAAITEELPSGYWAPIDDAR
jgi:hypothetical protein